MWIREFRVNLSCSPCEAMSLASPAAVVLMSSGLPLVYTKYWGGGVPSFAILRGHLECHVDHRLPRLLAVGASRVGADSDAHGSRVNTPRRGDHADGFAGLRHGGFAAPTVVGVPTRGGLGGRCHLQRRLTAPATFAIHLENDVWVIPRRQVGERRRVPRIVVDVGPFDDVRRRDVVVSVDDTDVDRGTAARATEATAAPRRSKRVEFITTRFRMSRRFSPQVSRAIGFGGRPPEQGSARVDS